MWWPSLTQQRLQLTYETKLIAGLTAAMQKYVIGHNLLVSDNCRVSGIHAEPLPCTVHSQSALLTMGLCRIYCCAGPSSRFYNGLYPGWANTPHKIYGAPHSWVLTALVHFFWLGHILSRKAAHACCTGSASFWTISCHLWGTPVILYARLWFDATTTMSTDNSYSWTSSFIMLNFLHTSTSLAALVRNLVLFVKV